MSGEIPSEPGSLSNLEWLTFYGNEFTGCVPAGFRDVVSNDLAQIELSQCDVLLSGLTLSPGSLVPQFDPYRTEYSASAGLSPITVTVTPRNDHNATFQFLDNNDVVLADTDNLVEGFQVEFGGRVPAVNITVVSQDTQATHTYVATDLGNRYDANADRVIQRDEVVSAIKDYFGNRITREEVLKIVNLYFSGRFALLDRNCAAEAFCPHVWVVARVALRRCRPGSDRVHGSSCGLDRDSLTGQQVLKVESSLPAGDGEPLEFGRPFYECICRIG